MDNNLQQGIAAAKAGDKPHAFDLLTRASQDPGTSELAWLWLSSVVNNDSERLYCLENTLRINPDNAAAKKGTSVLRQKGFSPSIPVYPKHPKTETKQDFTMPPVSSAKPAREEYSFPTETKVATSASISKSSFSFDIDREKKDLSGHFQYAMLELSNEKPHREVEKILVARGASPEDAKNIVADARYAIKKDRREVHKKRMKNGLIMSAMGIGATFISLFLSLNFGGTTYLAFYGLIIMGAITFSVGLIGWLVNR